MKDSNIFSKNDTGTTSLTPTKRSSCMNQHLFTKIIILLPYSL